MGMSPDRPHRYDIIIQTRPTVEEGRVAGLEKQDALAAFPGAKKLAKDARKGMKASRKGKMTAVARLPTPLRQKRKQPSLSDLEPQGAEAKAEAETKAAGEEKESKAKEPWEVELEEAREGERRRAEEKRKAEGKAADGAATEADGAKAGAKGTEGKAEGKAAVVPMTAEEKAAAKALKTAREELCNAVSALYRVVSPEKDTVANVQKVVKHFEGNELILVEGLMEKYDKDRDGEADNGDFTLTVSLNAVQAAAEQVVALTGVKKVKKTKQQIEERRMRRGLRIQRQMRRAHAAQSGMHSGIRAQQASRMV